MPVLSRNAFTPCVEVLLQGLHDRRASRIRSLTVKGPFPRCQLLGNRLSVLSCPMLSHVVPPVRDAAANAVAENPRAEGRARLACEGCEARARPREPGADPAFLDRSRDP